MRVTARGAVSWSRSTRLVDSQLLPGIRQAEGKGDVYAEGDGAMLSVGPAVKDGFDGVEVGERFCENR